MLATRTPRPGVDEKSESMLGVQEVLRPLSWGVNVSISNHQKYLLRLQYIFINNAVFIFGMKTRTILDPMKMPPLRGESWRRAGPVVRFWRWPFRSLLWNLVWLSRTPWPSGRTRYSAGRDFRMSNVEVEAGGDDGGLDEALLPGLGEDDDALASQLISAAERSSGSNNRGGRRCGLLYSARFWAAIFVLFTLLGLSASIFAVYSCDIVAVEWKANLKLVREMTHTLLLFVAYSTCCFRHCDRVR